MEDIHKQTIIEKLIKEAYILMKNNSYPDKFLIVVDLVEAEIENPEEVADEIIKEAETRIERENQVETDDER